MTQVSEETQARLGRAFPERQLSAEDKDRRKAEGEALLQRCQVIFERVRPELIENHYDWFIVIEPDSGDYFIEEDEMVAIEKAGQKYSESISLMFRLNETGACSRI